MYLKRFEAHDPVVTFSISQTPDFESHKQVRFVKKLYYRTAYFMYVSFA